MRIHALLIAMLAIATPTILAPAAYADTSAQLAAPGDVLDDALRLVMDRMDAGAGPTVRSSAALVWTTDESDPLGLFYMEDGWMASVAEEGIHSVLYFHNAEGVQVGRAAMEGHGLKFRVVEADRPVHRSSAPQVEIETGPTTQSVSQIDCGENNCVVTDINEVGSQIRHTWEVLNTSNWYTAWSCDEPNYCSSYAASVTGIWEVTACQPHTYVWLFGGNVAWTKLTRAGLTIAEDAGVTYWYSRTC